MFAIILLEYCVGPYLCNFLPSIPSLVAVVERHDVVELRDNGLEHDSKGSKLWFISSIDSELNATFGEFTLELT
jgi:hypothetical protein